MAPCSQLLLLLLLAYQASGTRLAAPEGAMGKVPAKRLYFPFSMSEPHETNLKRMYSSFIMNEDPAIPEGILCRIIVAMAAKVRKDLEKGDYYRNDMHTFLNLLKILSSPRFKSTC